MRRFCALVTLVWMLNWAIVAGAIGEAAAPAQPVEAAAPTPPAASADAPEVKPEELLRKMADQVCEPQAISCRVEAIMEINSAMFQNKQEMKTSIRIEKPNRLAVIAEGGPMQMTVVSDGKQLWQCLPTLKRYVVGPAPTNLAGLADQQDSSLLSMAGPLGNFIPTSSEALAKSLLEGVTGSKYLGQENISNEKAAEVMCHHLRFMQESLDWDIWIEAGKQPVPRKVTLDFSKQLAGAGPDAKGVKMSYAVTMNDWNTSPKFTASDFTFSPPPGAQEYRTIMPPEPAHPLLGNAAPVFATTDIDGKAIDIKPLVGKKVILLDFWATWCGPCVQAMPQVDEVAKKFKEKGLVFYAVNAGEEADVIKTFLTEAKMDVPVALDTDGKIAELYKVEGIPQTLLIGTDGKVQVVHVGFSPNLGQLLSEQIEAVLAGKELAAAELAKSEDKPVLRPSAEPTNAKP